MKHLLKAVIVLSWPDRLINRGLLRNFYREGILVLYSIREVIMQLKQVALVLIIGSSLCADSLTVRQAREAHSLPYLGSQQLDKRTLGSMVLKQDSADSRILQIKVVPQSAQGLTGLAATLQGSSCGYHAMKNGLLFSLALLEGSERDQYLQSLRSADYAHFLFGDVQAPWRQFIIQQRFKPIARKVYHRQVKKALKNCFKEDDQLLRRCINDLDLVDPVVSQKGFCYSADKAVVCSQLSQRMEKMISQGSKYSVALRRLHGRLNECFSDIAITFTIAFDGRCYEPYALTKTLAQFSGESYGRWVNSGEIIALVDHQRAEGLLQVHPRLLVATYGDDLGGEAEHAFTSEKLSQLYALVTETDDDIVGTVLVYLGGNKTDKSFVVKLRSWAGGFFGSFSGDALQLQARQDFSHWIALVVSRIKGDMRYYVLDSLNGTGALSRSRIRDLIDIFDGKKELPGYQWTTEQTLNVFHALEPKKPFLSQRTKVLLGSIGGSIGVAGLACYGYKNYFSGSNRSSED